jgi:hypothetical protein
MQTYINQLLADLEAAKTRQRPEQPDYGVLYPNHPAADPQYDGELDYIIGWEMGNRYMPAELFGIPPEAFPASERLTSEQIVSLCDAILSLWESYHILVSFPEKADAAVLYKWLVNEWKTGGENEEGFPLMEEGGHWHLETCHYDPTDCIWGEACTCKDYETEIIPEQTPEEKAAWEKGLRHHPNGGISWVNPDFLDENGNFDPSKLEGLFPNEDDDMPF